MIRRYTRSSQNALTIAANLVSLVLMILGLFVIPGRNGGWVLLAGLVLLSASSAYSWWLGQRTRWMDSTGHGAGSRMAAAPPERK